MNLREAREHKGAPVLFRPRPGVSHHGVLTEFTDHGRVYVRLENSKSALPVEPRYLELKG